MSEKAKKSSAGAAMDLGFAVGDRVRRKEIDGPLGTVQKVRIESTRSSVKKEGAEPPGITVSVLWDNGTLSHFVPGGLQRLSS